MTIGDGSLVGAGRLCMSVLRSGDMAGRYECVICGVGLMCEQCVLAMCN